MNKLIEKFKQLKAGTVIRTVLQILVYVNQAIALFGKSFAEWANNPIYQWISFGVTVVITLITYWYNNDWTSTAKTCSEIFDMLKDGKITQEEITTFINNHKSDDSSQSKVE